MNMHLRVIEERRKAESTIDSNSPLTSDDDTILYADLEDDKAIPGHTNVPILIVQVVKMIQWKSMLGKFLGIQLVVIQWMQQRF